MEQLGRIHKGIAVHDAIPGKDRVFQTGDHREYPLLFREFEVGLEADDVVEGAGLILPAQLDRCPGTVTGFRVPEPHRLERAEPHGISAPAGHNFNGHTALIDLEVPLFKLLELHALGVCQFLGELLIALLVKGAVDIVIVSPTVPGSKEHLVHIDAGRLHNGGGGVKEAEILRRDQLSDGGG